MTQTIILENNKPICSQFNKAIITLAKVTNPNGWDSSDKAPNSFSSLKRWARKNKKLCVYNGGSLETIFMDNDTNIAFRAWHDAAHLKYNYNFSLEGEIKTCYKQIEQLYSLYGQNQLWFDLLNIEIIEQGKYYQEKGHFLEDQLDFTKEKLIEYGYKVVDNRFKQDKMRLTA